jgi:hypothetical protein
MFVYLYTTDAVMPHPQPRTGPQPTQFERAEKIAQDLLAHLNTDAILVEIANRHVLGASSQQIQAVIEPADGPQPSQGSPCAPSLTCTGHGPGCRMAL